MSEVEDGEEEEEKAEVDDDNDEVITGRGEGGNVENTKEREMRQQLLMLTGAESAGDTL